MPAIQARLAEVSMAATVIAPRAAMGASKSAKYAAYSEDSTDRRTADIVMGFIFSVVGFVFAIVVIFRLCELGVCRNGDCGCGCLHARNERGWFRRWTISPVRRRSVVTDTAIHASAGDGQDGEDGETRNGKNTEGPPAYEIVPPMVSPPNAAPLSPAPALTTTSPPPYNASNDHNV